MNAEVFRISSDLNESLAMSAIEDATTDALSEDGRPHITEKSEARTAGAQPLTPDDRAGAPAIDADVLHFLYEQELTETLVTTPEMTRADIAVTVDRWLAALYGCHERIAEITEIRDRRVAMVSEPFDAQIAMHERRAAYLDGVLTQMARAFPYPQGSRSFPLAFGSIGVRKQSPKLVVVDERAVTNYAIQFCPPAVENVPTLRKKVLNEWWVSVGEPEVPGCVVEKPTEPDKPWVKVRGQK